MNFVSKLLNSTLLRTAMAIALLAPSVVFVHAQAPKDAKTAPKTAKTPKTATTAPTANEIADAQAKGLVWVNTDSGVYHKDGRFYGKTKQGQFMTEADAQKAGYRLAKDSAAKKSGSKTGTGATASTDNSGSKKGSNNK